MYTQIVPLLLFLDKYPREFTHPKSNENITFVENVEETVFLADTPRELKAVHGGKVW